MPSHTVAGFAEGTPDIQVVAATFAERSDGTSMTQGLFDLGTHQSQRRLVHGAQELGLQTTVPQSP